MMKYGVIVLILVFSLTLVGAVRESQKFSEEIPTSGRIDVIVKYKTFSLRSFATTAPNEEFINIDVNELAELKKDANVESIEFVPRLYPLLQDSVDIINASQTHQVVQSGFNLTGTGETVCVIDSGVDFTHPSLIGKNVSCVVDCFNKACVENCSVGDDFGHGTHVAGIIAASGGINGVAPGAKILAVAVFNSSGSTSLQQWTDLNNAINYCVSKKTQFNVSVISMSLGTNVLYENYCDSIYSSTASVVNNAALQNISIIAASGNSGSGIPRNTTAISSPACIQNVTSVSATNKDDSIASYAHYNHLIDLFAPGTLINSTLRGGGYFTSSGTSMAAPHVAGVFLVARQFYRLQNNREPTNLQIENAFKNNGFLISTAVGNFSRIDLFGVIEELSFEAELISPANNSYTNNSSRNFSCSGESLTSLTNSTFYLWNSTTLVYNQTKNVTGLSNSTTFSYNFTREGSYVWNCVFRNSATEVSAESNFTFVFDTTPPNQTSITPANNSWSNGNFTITLNEAGACNYSINSGTNRTMNSSDNLTFSSSNSTLIQNQSYNLSYSCVDFAGNRNTFQGYRFFFDAVLPEVNVTSPADGLTTESTSIEFLFRASDNLNLTSCGLLVNDVLVVSNSSALNSTNTLMHSFSVGSYFWKIRCFDEAGNFGNSSSRTLTISSPPSSQSSGGGGGGGGGGGSSRRTNNRSSPAENNSSNSTIPSIPEEPSIPEGEEPPLVAFSPPESEASENQEESNSFLTGFSVKSLSEGKSFFFGILVLSSIVLFAFYKISHRRKKRHQLAMKVEHRHFPTQHTHHSKDF